MTINYGQGTPERPSRGYFLFITGTVMVIVSGFFVLGRLWVRYKGRTFGMDDYTIAASLICSMILTLSMNESVIHGYGMHTKALSHEELLHALQWFYVGQVVYKVLLGLNKVSLLFLYLRIFVSRAFQITCYIVMTIVVSWSFSAIMATILQCIPVNAYWDRSIKTAKCTNTDAFWYAYAIINIITDVMILVLPLWEIRKLHLPMQQRAGLMAIFAIGGFVCATSIIRTNAVSTSMQNKKDSTWAFIPRSTWTLVEANVGIICACLPMLKGLIAIFPCLRTEAQSAEGRPSRYVYPLDSESNTWARSDGIVMSSVYHEAKGKNGKVGTESAEYIFGVDGEERGIVQKTDVMVEFDGGKLEFPTRK